MKKQNMKNKQKSNTKQKKISKKQTKKPIQQKIQKKQENINNNKRTTRSAAQKSQQNKNKSTSKQKQSKKVQVKIKVTKKNNNKSEKSLIKKDKINKQSNQKKVQQQKKEKLQINAQKDKKEPKKQAKKNYTSIFPLPSNNIFGFSSISGDTKNIFSVNSISHVNNFLTFPSNNIASTQNKQVEIKQQNKQKLKKSDKSLEGRYRTKSILDQLSNYNIQFDKQTKKFKIKMHSTYEIDQSHKLYESIQKLYHLFINKQRKKAQTVFLKTRYSFYPVFEFILAGQKTSQHKCCICQFQFHEPKQINQLQRQLFTVDDQNIVALKCSHLLHLQCLKMLIGQKQWFKCPVCSMIYGKMIGDQPSGSMNCTVNQYMHCDGYPEVGTIVIHYSMHSGKRGDVHFNGTHRTAYLPNNVQGNQVLNLLKQAFDRKLIFTIGRSVTTGRDNQVVWNGIHHKTNLSGGSAYFGYPDPTYFDRVKLQLAAKGIF